MFNKEMTKRLGPSFAANTGGGPSRKRHLEGTVWQRRFCEHQIRDEQDCRAHVEYLHFNPVKHGLAKAPAEWPRSSLMTWAAEGVYDEDRGSDGKVAFPEGFAGE